MYSDMKQSRILHKRLFITKYRLPNNDWRVGIVMNRVTGVVVIRTVINVYLFTWVIDIRYVYPRRKAKIIKLKPKKQDI